MTHRRARWLITLWRHSVPCAVHGAPWLRRALLRAGLAWLAVPHAGHAATLRVFNELSAPMIRLSDLFEQLEATPDRLLGPSPSPGARIVVEAPQLAAIARDFGVSWRPASGAERAVLERAGMPVPVPPILAALREALTAAGAPANMAVELPGFDPPTVPAGSDPHPAVAQVALDLATGRFTALLSVTMADAPAIHARLAGQILQMADAVVLTRPVRPGEILAQADLSRVQVRAGLLHGNRALSIDDLVGQALRRSLPQGQPLTNGDVSRPRLVTRNDSVRMALDASGITLSAQGIALEDGGLGDRIRVQNPASHAVIIAEIIAADDVRVTPGAAQTVAAIQ